MTSPLTAIIRADAELLTRLRLEVDLFKAIADRARDDWLDARDRLWAAEQQAQNARELTEALRSAERLERMVR